MIEISDEKKKELRKMNKKDFMRAMEELRDNDIVESENLLFDYFSTRSSREFYKDVISSIDNIRYVQNSWINEIHTFEDWNLRVDDYEHFWAVKDKKSKDVICAIEVSNDYDLPIVTAGKIFWYVKADSCNSDLLAEAIKTITKEYFKNRQLFESPYDLFEIRINQKHPGASEICEKAGFTKEGVLRNRCTDLKTGEICNMEVWSILQEEVLN